MKWPPDVSEQKNGRDGRLSSALMKSISNVHGARSPERQSRLCCPARAHRHSDANAESRRYISERKMSDFCLQQAHSSKHNRRVGNNTYIDTDQNWCLSRRKCNVNDIDQ